MNIWVDADACPVAIKNVLFRAAERTQTALTLVANQAIKTPPSRVIRAIQVARGFDQADNEIVRRCQPGDLVISADIPLADEIISKGGDVLTPRGERLTLNNIKAKLNMRDFMDTMRSSGVEMHGGPPPMNKQDIKAFADQLDRWLARAQPTRPD